MFNLREIRIIEAYKGKDFVGSFINMETLERILGRNHLTLKFFTINENDKRYKTLLEKGYVMNTPKLSKEEKHMLGLDLKDPDAIVNYIISFYQRNDIKSERTLLKKLEEQKPLRTAIELQNRRIK